MIGIFYKKTVPLIVILSILVYVYYTLLIIDSFEKGPGDLHRRAIFYTSKVKKYLINTSTCKIPDIDPFNEEVKKYVRKEKYTRCTNLGLLTYIEKHDGLVLLKINTSLLSQYSFFEINCCYSEIYRFNYENKFDNEVRYSPCTQFKDETVVSYPFIRVKCSNWFRYVYSNVHATVLPARHEVAHKINRTNCFSVLVVGIDSISKLNLRRTMPKTYAYLEQHFHGLKGYNKIGDNTFPNLMAILTGQSTWQLSNSCNKKEKLNVCHFIWNTFRELGYVTAYAEDENAISTFNYYRPGFRDPPTDYYYRPYMLASEELGRKLRYGMSYCTGPETSAERVLNAARDFSINLQDVPIFGLFWMNSFSHDDINMPSALDEKVLEFLSDSSLKSSLKNTVMVFLSDHGFRHGDIRLTRTGWLEDRLPFIYIYITDSFKKFREKYENFIVNTKRLTTPFDLYCTFQDILEIGNSSYKAKKSRECPNCQSLFTTIRENRTCREAAIDQHFCSCTGYNQVSLKNARVRQVALYVVKEINKFISNFVESRGCSTYFFKDIVTGGMSDYYSNENNQTVRQIVVVAETSPKAIFEATVEAYTMSEQNNFKLLGDISRVNTYKSSSYCVEDPILKKYCFCNRTAFTNY